MADKMTVTEMIEARAEALRMGYGEVVLHLNQRLGPSGLARAERMERAKVRQELARRLAAGGEGSVSDWLSLSDEQLAESARLAGVVEGFPAPELPAGIVVYGLSGDGKIVEGDD